MNLRLAIVIAACLLPAAAGSAVAQATWPAPQQQTPAPWPSQQTQQPQQPAATAWPQPAQPPAQAAPATAPWPAPQQQSRPSPWQQPPQQQQQPDPACFKQFIKLREAAQKRATAIQTAGKHKPNAKEACGLFNAFSAAEAKMIKFVVANRTACNVPPAVIDGMKKQHGQTLKIRGNICRAAAAPRGPAPPSLSDALSAPIADPNNIKSGGGTFDTLGGNPLGR